MLPTASNSDHRSRSSFRYRAPLETITACVGTSVPSDSVTHEPAVHLQGLSHARARDERTELLRLDEGFRRQFGAGQTGRKAQVVLDARARCSLTADCVRVEEHRIEALGGSIDGGCKTGWSTADDHEIEVALADSPIGQPEILGELSRCGVPDHVVRGHRYG